MPQPVSPPTLPRHQRCLDTFACRVVKRAPLHLPAIACSVSAAILGRTAHTGTGSLRYAEVAAWADGEAAFRFGPESGEHTIWQYHPETADFSAIYQSPRTQSAEVRLRDELARLEARAADPMAAARTAIAEAVALWRRYGEEFLMRSVGAGIGVGYDPDDLELMVTAPELFRRKILLQADHAIAIGRAMLAAGLPPVMSGGGDLAGSQGPIYSPAMFRDIVLPGYVRAMSALNQLGIHYYFCSDGNLWPLMDMLFTEAGCPGYGEMDRDATMTVAAVRARFPRLVIWSNVSSSLLMYGTAAEVRDQAQASLDEAEGRGYFQGCSNAIVHGTPVENVQAMMAVR
ncbi:MAG: hypothetical protein NT173_11000 [Opitutales bacterium]|nr:hypothetical protein [Opitutales bacterium]